MTAWTSQKHFPSFVMSDLTLVDNIQSQKKTEHSITESWWQMTRTPGVGSFSLDSLLIL